MSDITEQQMNDLIRALEKSSGSLGKLADNFGKGSKGKSDAVDTVSKDLSNSQKTMFDKLKGNTSELASHFSGAGNSSREFASSLSSATKMFAGGFILKKIFDYGTENVEMYRQLSNQGQSFGGSMIEMSRQAAAAGLPMEDFAKIIKHNSVVVKQMGTEAFFKLNKSIRQSIEANGMYGMSMEQLGEFTSDYLEIQRISGKNLKNMNGPAAQKDIKDFALAVTEVSDALGASREAVMKATSDALHDSVVSAQMRLNTMAGMDGYNKAMMKATASLAAQPGEAGKMLSKGLADAFGTTGGAIFTDLGKTMIEAGQSQLVGVMDDANRRIQAGEDASMVTMDTISKLHDQLTNPQTLESLKLLASQGNAAAKQLLAMAADLKTYTKADLEAAKKARESMGLFTSFFTSFESVFSGLKGALIDGFLAPLMGVGKELDPTKVKAFWDSIRSLEPQFKAFGESIGKFVISFFTKENMDRLAAGVKDFVNFVGTVVKIGAGIISFFVPLAAGLGKIVGWTHDFLSTVIGWVPILGKFKNGIAAVIIGLGLLVTFLKLKDMAKKTFATGKVDIKAGVVNVNGGVGGGGGGGAADDILDNLGDDDGKKGGKRKKWGNPKERAERLQRLRRGRAAGLRGRGASRALRLANAQVETEKSLAKPILGARGQKWMEGASKFGKGIGDKVSGAGKTTAATAGKGLAENISGKVKSAGKGLASSGIGSKIATFGKGISSSGIGKAAGVLGKHAGALGAVLAIGGGLMGLKEIKEKVAAGEMTAEEGHKAASKLLGGMAGGAAGSAIGGGIGAALGAIGGPPGILIGGIIGATVGGLAGEKIGSFGGEKIGGMFSPKAAAGPKGSGSAQQPKIVDDEALAQTRTNAILGDKDAIDQLKKIQEGLEKQTMSLYSVQRKTLEEQRKAASAAQAANGY